MKVLSNVVTITAILILFSGDIFAQTFKATVVGQVTDATGAVVPNATVTITQDGTNQTQTVTTNEDGSYVSSQLAPGSYTLKVEGANFKTSINTGLVLETAKSTRLNVALEAGNISEQVTVTAEAAVIDTETSSKGEVITPRQVQDLPLNGRNFTDLALLTPGVYPRPADDDQGEGLAASGTRTDASNFILDGVVSKSEVDVGVFELTTAAPLTRRAFDFDGDGRADLAVFRPSSGFWFIRSNSGGFSSVQYGISTDKPIPAAYLP